MIKYLGSKRLLLPAIVDLVREVDNACTVVDLFSGTARVGHALKGAGYRVLASDHNAYAATLARAYVQADAEEVLDDAQRLIVELNRLPGAAGWFTETFCVRSRYFQPRNGERIDAIREEIARKALKPELEAVVMVALMEAADRVDSTTGVQMAYLKQWAPRAANVLELRVPDVRPRSRHGKGEAHQLDALEAARLLEGDVAYVDPPYNQHSYLGNYHIWESLVRWDKPEVYGVACKRLDVRDRTSAFNSRPRSGPALRTLLTSIRARVLIVSFNDEGFHSRAELAEMMRAAAGPEREVVTIERDFKRYVGAQIGIYNPQGVKVGKVSHLRNKELLFVAAPRELAARFAPRATANTAQRSLFG